MVHDAINIYICVENIKQKCFPLDRCFIIIAADPCRVFGFWVDRYQRLDVATQCVHRFNKKKKKNFEKMIFRLFPCFSFFPFTASAKGNITFSIIQKIETLCILYTYITISFYRYLQIFFAILINKLCNFVESSN